MVSAAPHALLDSKPASAPQLAQVCHRAIVLSRHVYRLKVQNYIVHEAPAPCTLSVTHSEHEAESRNGALMVSSLNSLQTDC